MPNSRFIMSIILKLLNIFYLMSHNIVIFAFDTNKLMIQWLILIE